MTDGSATQPPGWYYAQGDPPGTQRYWDGGQWQGGPQPVAGAGGQMAGGVRYAQNGARFVAFLVDWGIAFGANIVFGILAAIVGDNALGTIISLLGSLAVLAYYIYNYIFLQGTTGQTIGKKMQGIKLVDADTNQPLGMLMVFVRSIVSTIFLIPCLLDHWWILVDQNNQRLSDKVLTNHVIEA